MIDLEIELPKHFLEEEIRNGYKVSAKMKKVWAVELDLLQEFLRVCKKYELKCYADAGTLLGAVRHKGFIPWDDDIDLVMFRNDYEKLEEIASKEFASPYFFQTVYTDKLYAHGHAQLRNMKTTGILKKERDRKLPFVQGIFIDIFVLDAVSENRAIIILQRKVIRILNILMACCVTYREYLGWKGRIVRNILGVIRIDHIKLYRLKEYILKAVKIQLYERVAPLSFRFETEKRVRNKKWYKEIVWLDFESMSIPAPAGYDEFLRGRYGNYMECKQVPTTHGEVIFDPDIPYTEYLR